MTDSFSTLRSRIHTKSHQFFVFAFDRWDRDKRSMFYGAMDALLDASTAAESYGRAISSDLGSNLLACYGFLQALYVQQDAVLTLSRAVGLNWRPADDVRLREIRDVRNRLTGHPALAGERRPSRLSSAIIPYDSITHGGFRGHVYYLDGVEDIAVDVASFQNDNECQLALQMQAVEHEMDRTERQFREEQAKRPLSRAFDGNFDYLLQRLHCDLVDEGRVGQAQTHARMIRDRVQALKKELMDRGFRSEADSLQTVFTGLDLLEQIMGRGERSNTVQDEFDLLYDGLDRRVRSLRASIGAIDAKFLDPI